ncbi:Heat shock protein 70 LHS1 [Candida viswanathii]|uniref:Heat shock protein 70 LHS1 n=1 Tax=Candida viswanathii TaxID=5486 RepID=A0A367YMA0_9ASCO|nr:Heat shock protein 70 LHS1 [Candida viswanathii]
MKCLLFISFIIATVSAAILGIDYGQQLTKAVLLAPGVPFEIVLTDEGKRKDLSGICLRKLGKNDLERVYGSQMGSLTTRFPGSCILDLKQLLGKSIDDPEVTKFVKEHYVKLIPDESRNGIKFDLGFDNSTLEFSVEEILAMQLNDIKNRALAHLEENPHAAVLVEDVAVAIPPFASQATRQAYLDSLQLGNFSNVLGLVEEGTSVALNYISNKKLDQEEYDNVKHYYLVYDVGAGYTTATLFSFTPKTIGQLVLEIESIGADESFGGRTLTNSIYSLVLEKFLNHFGLEESDVTDKIAAKLNDIAEKAKIILSVNNEYHTTLESIYDDKDFKVLVTRQEFEDVNSDLMEHISNPVLKALAEAGLKVEDIESVILNGGSTRVPFVQKHIASLVGDRISKSVNTDESAALGTTLRGLKWKTNSVNSKDIALVEKNHHNFEIGVNGQDEQLLVFPKHSSVGNTTKLNLGKLENDDLSISLYEDGQLFKTFTFDDIASRAKKLSCKSKQDKEVIVKLELDDNKMFDLIGIELACSAEEEKSFLGKLLNKDNEEAEEDAPAEEDVKEATENEEGEAEKSSNDTESTKPTSKSTKKAKPAKTVYVPIPKATYPHIKPIGRMAKRTLFDKLAYLNAQDEIKIATDQTKNVLEANCYQLREFLEENEATLSKEMNSEDIEAVSQYISDLIEWLDFESDDSSIEELKSKVEEVDNKTSELKRIIEVTNADLTQEGMKKLYDDSSKLIMTIQTSMLQFGTKISEMRAKYEEAGLDFDKENERIKQKLVSKGEDKMVSFDRALKEYKEVITAMGKILEYDSKEFAKLTKSDLYSYHEKLAKGVSEMLGDIISIETVHLERMEMFENQYKKLLERKKQQEFRKKLREAQKAAKEEAKEDEEEQIEIFEEDDEEVPVESSSTAQESQTSEPIAEDDDDVGYQEEVEEDEEIEHDEL